MIYIQAKQTCTDPESFVRGGPTDGFYFSLGEDPNTITSGPSLARQQKAI